MYQNETVGNEIHCWLLTVARKRII